MKYAEQCSWRSLLQILRDVQRHITKLRSISDIKRNEEREREKREKEKRKKEWKIDSGEALCFLALTVPRSRTTGGHVAKCALCSDLDPFLSFSLTHPERLIVAKRRIAVIQCARTRVLNRFGCLKPVCASDEFQTSWRFASAIIRGKIFTEPISFSFRRKLEKNIYIQDSSTYLLHI